MQVKVTKLEINVTKCLQTLLCLYHAPGARVSTAVVLAGVGDVLSSAACLRQTSRSRQGTPSVVKYRPLLAQDARTNVARRSGAWAASVVRRRHHLGIDL
jgi:hypothetical protein